MAQSWQECITGVNFGGWISQSDLSRERLETFITEADFRFVKEQGFNTVRLPFNAQLVFTPKGELDPEGVAWLDKAVAWAEAEGLRLILDLHEIEGHSFVDMNGNGIYTSREMRKRACRLWAALAERYLAKGNELLFELLNEPVAPTAEAWQDLAEEMTAAIRDRDERRPLIVGSNLWNCAGEYVRLKPTGDARTVYTFHFYEPNHFTHQSAPWVAWTKKLPMPQPYPGEARGVAELLGKGDVQAEAQAGHLVGYWDAARLDSLLKPVLEFRDRHQVSVFCGEFGVYLAAPRENQLRWMEDFTGLLVKHRFGFTYWSYRDMDFGLFYRDRPWGHLPQYQNPGNLDSDLLALLARRAGELKV